MHTFFQVLSVIDQIDHCVSNPDRSVLQLFYDSRLVRNGSKALFFALVGNGGDGHRFIPELAERGVNQWVISDPVWAEWLKNQKNHNWILVKNPIQALQALAAWHRNFFSVPVLGITGSNGKTIVKEWLAQLIGPDFLVCKSPKSFNSQIGVPISVWNLSQAHNLAIFEAGISQKGEMKTLEDIIKPSIGIFTNLGEAHSEGFQNQQDKLSEKLQLFANSSQLIVEEEVALANMGSFKRSCPNIRLATWKWTKSEGNEWSLVTADGTFPFKLPFLDPASVQNLGNALAAALLLGVHPNHLSERLTTLSNPTMRLSLKEGQNECTLVDDSYTNDLVGLEAALQFAQLQRKPGQEITLVISDFDQKTLGDPEVSPPLVSLLQDYEVRFLLTVGSQEDVQIELKQGSHIHFSNVEELLLKISPSQISNHVVLVKGSRKFGMERVVKAWQKKIHGTRLEINLDALTDNLNFYRSQLPTGTAVMAMVKALGYGSGGAEVARTLAYHRVDYLAVAYLNEGVELRQAGIVLPIMVMNPMPETLEELIRNNLEPEIYSFNLLESFLQTGAKLGFSKLPPIHLKIDTGMHRLGFMPEEIEALINMVRAHPEIRVGSVFSHLVGADSDELTTFSKLQIERFTIACQFIKENLGISFKRHLLNSAGILRFPEATFEMVRLGIGLYGLEVNSWFQDHLSPVSALKTTISQIKTLTKEDTVGYGRLGTLKSESRIATLAIGYADGFRRAFSNRKAKVLVGGMPAPVVGNVCMDMTMIDVTNCICSEGDEVVIFENAAGLRDLALAAETIPYEILTGIGQRVKRIFFRQ